MQDFTRSTVYQIYIKSFADSNGDGIGDLGGIRAKLPYLASLGVDYVWITPFFVSPMNDNGYDVADYYSINPMFGTMADAEALIAEAAQHGIGLMFDMVFNHTSTEHEWFRRALAGEKEYQDFYIFREGRRPEEVEEPEGLPFAPDGSLAPTNWESKFGGNAWEWAPQVGKWYLHLFDRTQADLNWDNPRVREEMKKVVRFWKDKGVRGFRFDVVNLISKPSLFEDDAEGDGRRFYTDGPHIHEYLHELVHDTGIADMITVGEMSSTSLENCIGYSRRSNEELAMVFSFHHLKVDYADGDKWALAPIDYAELRRLLSVWQEEMAAAGGWNALFLNNHDQPRAVSRFVDLEAAGTGGASEAGSAARTAGSAEAARTSGTTGPASDTPELTARRAKTLAALTHLMRGTPYVYQGEEIGMTNAGFSSIGMYRDVESTNHYKLLSNRGLSDEEAMAVLMARSRDNSRTPMQWTGGPAGGFTSGTPWLGLPEGHEKVSVEAQLEDPDSVLGFYRRLIALRKEIPAISDGSIRFVDAGDDKVLAFVREHEGQRLAVACSLAGRATTVRLPELASALGSGELLIGDVPVCVCAGTGAEAGKAMGTGEGDAKRPQAECCAEGFGSGEACCTSATGAEVAASAATQDCACFDAEAGTVTLPAYAALAALARLG